jgi:hypothetical protein
MFTGNAYTEMICDGDLVNSITMADPKYADLAGIVRYLDKNCTIFAVCAVI